MGRRKEQRRMGAVACVCMYVYTYSVSESQPQLVPETCRSRSNFEGPGTRQTKVLKPGLECDSGDKVWGFVAMFFENPTTGRRRGLALPAVAPARYLRHWKSGCLGSWSACLVARRGPCGVEEHKAQDCLLPAALDGMIPAPRPNYTQLSGGGWKKRAAWRAVAGCFPLATATAETRKVETTPRQMLFLVESNSE
jgi:hypothetical protein